MSFFRREPLSARVAVMAALLAAASSLVLGCSARASAAPARGGAAAENATAVAVAAERPQLKTVQGRLALNGTIRADSEVQVIAETEGRVVRVFFQNGDRVKKDDPLVLIDDELKKAAFETAQAAFDKSSADWKRAQDLFTQKVIAEAELQGSKLALANAKFQLTSSRRDLDNASVKAPISGVVTQKLVNEGAVLSKNAAVAHIVDAQHLKILVQVGERAVLKIKEGMSVTIESDLYPGVTFHGRVTAICPKGDSALTFPVEIGFTSDPRTPLYDGMSAKISVELGERSILALPRTSLVNSYQRPQVFVVRQGKATLVDIVSGSEYGTDLEVLGGLAPEDLVVTSGQNNLSEGQRVDVVGGGA